MPALAAVESTIEASIEPTPELREKVSKEMKPRKKKKQQHQEHATTIEQPVKKRKLDQSQHQRQETPTKHNHHKNTVEEPVSDEHNTWKQKQLEVKQKRAEHSEDEVTDKVTDTAPTEKPIREQTAPHPVETELPITTEEDSNIPDKPTEPTKKRFEDFYLKQRSTVEKAPLQQPVRDEIRRDIESDEYWVADKIEKFEKANTVEEKKAIREEISVYVQERKEERRQKVLEAAELPEAPSAETIDTIINRYQQISDRLTDNGIDTSELNDSLTGLETAQTALQEAKQNLDSERTVDNLMSLKQALEELKLHKKELRNQVQSVLVN